MRQSSFTKEFPDYEAATRWLYDHGFRSGCIDIMQHGDVVLTLDGEDAVRARNAECPLAEGGFHLVEVR